MVTFFALKNMVKGTQNVIHELLVELKYDKLFLSSSVKYHFTVDHTNMTTQGEYLFFHFFSQGLLAGPLRNKLLNIVQLKLAMQWLSVDW